MLSIDLFDSKYERELREGAVDDLEARRIDDLNMRMLDLLDRARESTYKKNPAALADLKQQFQKIKAERDSYYKINPATGMDPTGSLGTVKGALDEVGPTSKSPAKGQDLISPQQRVAGAMPAKPGVAGAVKDVAGGVKRWLKGEPDQGPTYESQKQETVTETVTDVRAGMAQIYRRLAPKIERHRDSFLAGQLYDELENYAELHGAEGEFKRMMNGARNRAHMEYDTNPGGFHNWFWFLPFEDNDVAEAISKKDLLGRLQKNLPKVNDPKNKHAKPVNWTGPGKDDYGYTGYQGHGMPTDKQERARIRADKKKGVAEGLPQTLRKVVPGYARREIDRKMDAEKFGRTDVDRDANYYRYKKIQDKLKEQDMAESTNDIKKRMSKLEALALAANRAGDDAKCKMYQQKIQALKQKLSQSMTEELGDSPVAGAITRRIMSQHLDLLKQYGPELVGAAVDNVADFVGDVDEIGSSDVSAWVAQVERMLQENPPEAFREGWSDQGNPTAYSVYIDGREWKAFASDDHARAVATKVETNLERQGRKQTVTIAPSKAKKVQESDEQLLEGIRDTASATAVIACLLTGGSLSGCATAPQQTSAQQVLKTGQDIGRTVQTAKKITRAGTEAEVQQELRNILRGINRPEELNNSNIIRIWKRIKGQPPVQPEPQAPEYGPADPVKRAQFEAREIVSKEDFVRERDRLLRMIGQETNPANKQILKSAIRQLENRAENKGWVTTQNRMIREENDSQEVEQAILKRIMVAHTDLLKQFGPQKVMQAAEEVAYNVGDVDEIGTSDVSGWVRQVQQILGAVQEGLRDPADNPCWKGYKPVGTKQKGGRTVPNCVPKQ
jgi:hypothetical protein